MDNSGNELNGEESSVWGALWGLAVFAGAGYVFYAFFFPLILQVATGKDESLFRAAFTPGLSTREDFSSFNDAGGLGTNGTFLRYDVAEVRTDYAKSGVLKGVIITLKDHPAPVPKDIREKLSEICGSESWKNISSRSPIVGYETSSSTHKCLYSFSTDGAFRSHKIVIESR